MLQSRAGIESRVLGKKRKKKGMWWLPDKKKRSNECTDIQSIMNGEGGCENTRKDGEKKAFATEEKRNCELAYPVHSA
ncbi:hypothetical protein ACN38_g9336 [Penicillium nordicum]|uniref:Uncharacterized protein n=1 Tax=Penicillium nordicum TaxID=229535 RepID=A0A0M8NUR1_9EURO|nr:hypothetical protein ACN38_g9336 [Penicillium nordicum]